MNGLNSDVLFTTMTNLVTENNIMRCIKIIIMEAFVLVGLDLGPGPDPSARPSPIAF